MCSDEEFIKHIGMGSRYDINRVILVQSEDDTIALLCNALWAAKDALNVPEFWEKHEKALNLARGHWLTHGNAHQHGMRGK